MLIINLDKTKFVENIRIGKNKEFEVEKILSIGHSKINYETCYISANGILISVLQIQTKFYKE